MREEGGGLALLAILRKGEGEGGKLARRARQYGACFGRVLLVLGKLCRVGRERGDGRMMSCKVVVTGCAHTPASAVST